MSVVLASVADAAVIAALEMRNMRYPHSPWSRAMIEQAMAHGTVFLLDESKRGYVSLVVSGVEAEINNVCVDSEWRRQGIARRLVGAAIELGEKMGAGEIFLEVAESNAAARALYGGFGFEVVAKREKYYADEAALILRLKLGVGFPNAQMDSK